MQNTLKHFEAVGRRRRRRKKLAGSISFFSKKIVYVFGFIFVVLAFSYGLFISQIFQISKVTATGIYRNEQFTAEMNSWKGKNILFFRTTNYKKMIGMKFPELTNVTVKKQLPQTIVVAIEQREPIALLTVRQTVVEHALDATQSATIAAVPVTKTVGKYHLDAYGVPFAKVDDIVVIVDTSATATAATGSLPAIIYTANNEVVLGQKLDDAIIQQAIALLQASKSTQFRTIQVTKISDVSFEALLIDGMRVFFSTDKDIQSQLAALQIIYESSTIDKKKAKSIDVRYNKPVVKF